MLWLMNLGFAAGGTVTPPAPEPTGQTPAGRKRRHQYVEIDGQRFSVTSVHEAQQLLQRARAIAERQAEEKANKATKALRRREKVPAVRLAQPSITASPEIREELQPLIDSIRSLYERAAMQAELRLLMLKQLEEEDEEDVLMLLS